MCEWFIFVCKSVNPLLPVVIAHVCTVSYAHYFPHRNLWVALKIAYFGIVGACRLVILSDYTHLSHAILKQVLRSEKLK